nr:MinD/ParA family protein [Virgibacillus doumboii]
MVHDQAESLRRQVEHTREPGQAKTIAVVSGKGGVGKSNVALNFALELLRHDNKVLLFDLDVGMGNIDILLGLHAEKSIVDMFNNQLTVHDIIETGPRGISYVAAGSGLTDFFTMNQEKRDYFFRQYDELITIYDYIIFDMGAGVTNDSLSFIVASDECIVVTTPEPTSITDAYGMIKHIINRQQSMPVSVIMNRSSIKNGSQTMERFRLIVEQFLNIKIRKLGILPDDKTVSAAVVRQIPYVLLNEKAAVSRAIKDITIDYLQNGSEAKNQKSASFVQRLKAFVMER